MEAHPKCLTGPGRTPLKHWPCQFPTYLNGPISSKHTKLHSVLRELIKQELVPQRQFPKKVSTNLERNLISKTSWKKVKTQKLSCECKSQQFGMLAACHRLFALRQNLGWSLIWKPYTMLDLGPIHSYLTCGNLKCTHMETPHHARFGTHYTYLTCSNLKFTHMETPHHLDLGPISYMW